MGKMTEKQLWGSSGRICLGSVRLKQQSDEAHTLMCTTHPDGDTKWAVGGLTMQCRGRSNISVVFEVTRQAEIPVAFRSNEQILFHKNGV